MPAINPDELPPLENPRIPVLDDQSLAQMLAELEGEDVPSARSQQRGADRQAESAVSKIDRPGDAATQRSPGESSGQQLSAKPADPSVVAPEAHADTAAPVAPEVSSSSAAPNREPRGSESSEPEPLVIQSEFGEYRPPVTRVPEQPSLTGITQRSLGKVGSILFTWAFAVIFLLILIQALISLLTAGTGP